MSNNIFLKALNIVNRLPFFKGTFRSLLFNKLWILIVFIKPIRNFYFKYELSKINNSDNYINKNKPTLAIVWEPRLEYAKRSLLNKEEFNVVIVPRSFFNPGFYIYLREYNASIANLPIGEYNLDFYRSDKFNASRQKYRKYCQLINTFLTRFYNVQCVLMPKCNDHWTIDYIKAANISNLKVVIDDREGACTSQRLKAVAPRLRGLDMDFDLMTTHNPIHKELFEKAGFPLEKIVVNGAVQSDYWLNNHYWKEINEVDKNIRKELIRILFFSFGERTYMNFYYGNENRTWAPLAKDINDVLFKILDKYEGRIQVIYKFSGKIKRDTSLDLYRFKSNCKRFIDQGYLLFLGGSTSSFDLIRHSQIISGFQTSGMIEAMNTDKPIIYSAWGDLYEDIGETLLPIGNKECALVASSKDEFFDHLSKSIEHAEEGSNYSKHSSVSRQILVDKYFSKQDGKVSERLSQLVAKVMA